MYFYYRENLYKRYSEYQFIKKDLWLDPADRKKFESLDREEAIEFAGNTSTLIGDDYYNFNSKKEFREWFLFDYYKSEKTYDILTELFELSNTTLTVKDLKDALCDVDVLEILQKRLETDTSDIELAYIFLESFSEKQSAKYVYRYIHNDQEFKGFGFENDLNAPEYQYE